VETPTATLRTLPVTGVSWRVTVHPHDRGEHSRYFDNEREAQDYAERYARGMELENVNHFPTGMRAWVTLVRETVEGVRYY